MEEENFRSKLPNFATWRVSRSLLVRPKIFYFVPRSVNDGRRVRRFYSQALIAVRNEIAIFIIAPARLSRVRLTSSGDELVARVSREVSDLFYNPC